MSAITLSSTSGCTSNSGVGHFKITGGSSMYALLGMGSPSCRAALGSVFSTTFFGSAQLYGFNRFDLSVLSAGTTSTSIAPRIANSSGSSL